MLKLISLKSCVATLQFQTNHTLSILDYNPDTRTSSPFRYMNFSVPALYADHHYIEKLLTGRPKARIIHILTHDQRRGFYPVFESDGGEYIDDFGYQLYIGREVDWFGELTDIDERFEGVLPF